MSNSIGVPRFGLEEEVKLAPWIFENVCKWLNFYPKIDLFASANHHQLPCYFTADRCDFQANGCNSFNFEWNPEIPMYANPPWTLVRNVLGKIWKERANVMVVTPVWKFAPWYDLLERMTVKGLIWEHPLYLDEGGQLRPAPRWKTRFSIVAGSLI